MKISVEQAMDIAQNDIENFVFKYMDNGKFSAEFMVRVLEGILLQIIRLKSQDLIKVLLEEEKNTNKLGGEVDERLQSCQE